MFFGKKVNIVPPEPPAQFKKEKLSDEALDHFAEKYKVDRTAQPEKYTFPYTLRNGTQIEISRNQLFDKNKIALRHFEYLLGQTLPYHRHTINYSLKDLMYILDEKGNPTLWTRNKQSIVQFAKITEYLGLLIDSEIRK